MYVAIEHTRLGRSSQVGPRFISCMRDISHMPFTDRAGRSKMMITYSHLPDLVYISSDR